MWTRFNLSCLGNQPAGDGDHEEYGLEGGHIPQSMSPSPAGQSPPTSAMCGGCDPWRERTSESSPPSGRYWEVLALALVLQRRIR